jgi:hypothetical protein
MLKVTQNEDFAVAERFLCDIPIEYFIYVNIYFLCIFLE